ncbi:MAG TPA: DUF2723 domain-containing protein [Candidatus Limnocylindrales bacterium]|nr:DUF2723 domain-containing protein [Candidatus Limnocylindrales bacterium]
MSARVALARALPPLAVALVALAVIVPTVQPGVGFWDTAEAQTVPPLLGVMHPTGFPAYVVTGWLATQFLAPLGEPAFRMNVLSALLVATAAGLTVVLVRRLTDSTAIGVAAGIGLALTPITWAIGTRADVHALHLALAALLLVLLVEWERRRAAGAPRADRWLVAASVVFGLAMANHTLTLLLPPAIGLFVLAVEPAILRRPRLVLACLVAITVTVTVLYLELPLRAGPFRAPLVYGRPETLDGFRYIVLAEQFRGSLIDPLGDLPGKIRNLAGLTANQFGILAPLVPIGLLAAIRRAPRYALLSGIAALATVFFAASYANADISRYYLVPALIAWSWLGILAATAVEALEALTGPDDSPAGVAAAGLLGLALLVPSLGALPDRAARLDLSRDRSAARWLDAALGAMEPDAVVVSWWSYSTTLWYAQHIEGRFADGFVVDDRTRLDLELGEVHDVIDAHLGRRPVYVVRSSMEEVAALRGSYALEAIPGATMLYRVVERRGAGS